MNEERVWGSLDFPGWWAPVLTLGGGILATWLAVVVAAAAFPPGPAITFFGVLAFPVATALLSVWIIARHNGLSWSAIVRSAAVVRRADWRYIGLYLVVVLPVALAVAALSALVGLEPGQEVVTTLARPEVMVLSFTVVPLGEELWGRGLVYGVLRRWGPVVAVVGTGLVTAVWHLDPAQIVGTLPGMLGLSWMRQATNRLGPSVVAHGLNNLAATLALLALGAAGGGT